MLIPALLVSNKSSAQERITGDIVVCSAPKDNSPGFKGKIAIGQEIQKPEKITIAGKVTDERLQPIPGATIIIRETGKGVVSDNDGDFKVKVAHNSLKSVLVASCIGLSKKLSCRLS